ncbi:MAG: lysoplasmalogenase [Proteobacteria bacterium]|nr:lysoplasmalogenase [Pseudomonadota bacterium]
MLNTLIIAVAASLLILLLYARKKKHQKVVLLAKTALSLMFILAVWLQPHPTPVLYHLLLAGMCFCAGGDVCLALTPRWMFPVGLTAFLLGYLCYFSGFCSIGTTNQWTWIGASIVIFVSTPVYLWLRPHLGSMKIPVLIYIVVIGVMLVGAWSVLGNVGLALSGRVLVFSGTLLVYCSDIFVARNRFIKDEFLNRLLGLPVYYVGQFFLAFSVGLF